MNRGEHPVPPPSCILKKCVSAPSDFWRGGGGGRGRGEGGGGGGRGQTVPLGDGVTGMIKPCYSG